MKKLLSVVTLLAAVLVTASAQAADLHASGACSSAESWSGKGAGSLNSMISGEVSPTRGYARAIVLEKNVTTPELRAFGLYLEARALNLAGLDTEAMDGFSSLASAAPSPEIANIQVAAMECMNVMVLKHPGMSIPADARRNLSVFSRLNLSASHRQVLHELELNTLSSQIAEGARASEIEATLSELKDSGIYQSVGVALIASAQKNYPRVITELTPVFAKHAVLPGDLARQTTHMRLLLARAYYSTRQYSKAIAQYQLVDRKSNEISEALSELSWSYLMEEHYGDAVGTAVSLRVGEMKQTFAPESTMVMAMALNELCQYQDSLRSIQTLQRDYDSSYHWLRQWSDSRKNQALYPLALQFLKNDNQDIPPQVAGEWIRSNLFLAGQDEIHRLFGEADKSEAFMKASTQELSAMGEKIRDMAGDKNLGVREDHEGIHVVSTGKDPIPVSISALAEEFNQVHDSLASLEKRLGESSRALEGLRAQWVDRINAELARRNARMLAQLEEVRENSKLIQIEIYNGASHDMIWRNAHPDYASIAKHFKENIEEPSGSEVWKWGSIDPNSDSVEIWEDELGDFKAGLRNNCKNKEKYLALKTQVAKNR